MDYQQSFDNLNRLKNSIRLWTDCQIFFFFTSEADFEIYIYEKELTDEQQAKVDENLYSTKPYGLMMFEESGQETLYYKDDMIDIHYDMFLEELIEVGYNDPIDMEALRKELLFFFKMMENK